MKTAGIALYVFSLIMPDCRDKTIKDIPDAGAPRTANTDLATDAATNRSPCGEVADMGTCLTAEEGTRFLPHSEYARAVIGRDDRTITFYPRDRAHGTRRYICPEGTSAFASIVPRHLAEAPLDEANQFWQFTCAATGSNPLVSPAELPGEH